MARLVRWTRRLAVPALGMLAVGGLWLVVRPSPAFGDAEVVYCLGPEQGPRLAAAAETLGLATHAGTGDRVRIDGRELAVADWRAERPADFRRACLALNPPRPTGPPTAVQTGLVATANVIVGGLIGYYSAAYRDRVNRREQQARQLHTTSTAFAAAVENYLQSWADPTRSRQPEATEVRSRRRDLVAELGLVAARDPAWPAPREAIARVDAELGEAITHGWPGDATQRAARAAELTTTLRRVSERVDAVTVELERPGRRAAAP